MTVASEHALVTTARGLLTTRFGSPRIATARAAADSLKKLVLASEDDAVMVTAALKQVADGKRAVDEARREILDLPLLKAALEVVEALKTTSAVVLADLKSGDSDGRAALLAFQRQREQEAQREVLAAQARAREAARNAAVEGEDVPPAAEPAPAEAPTIVRAGSAQTHISTKLCVELQNHHDCDPTWLKLNEQAARWYGQDYERREAMHFPIGRDKAVTINGVKFWRERGVVVR